MLVLKLNHVGKRWPRLYITGIKICCDLASDNVILFSSISILFYWRNGHQMSGPVSSIIVRALRGVNPKVMGWVPLRSRHFLSLKLRHFHKKIRSWVENGWCYLKKYLYRQSQYSRTRDSKCLALIAQVVRAFGMNPMVGGSSPPQVETFSVPKTSTLSQEHPSVSRKMNAVARAYLTFQMLILLQKYQSCMTKLTPSLMQ